MGGYGEGPASGYGGYGGGPMTVQTTEVSQAQVRLDGIEQARMHETSYQRTEYAGVAGAVLGAGVAMVRLILPLALPLVVYCILYLETSTFLSV